MNNNVKVLISVLIFFVIGSQVVFFAMKKEEITTRNVNLFEMGDGDWIIDGNTVYVDDTNIYASATPHTLHGSNDVIFEFEYKGSTEIDIDYAWGFNGTQILPISIQIISNYTHEGVMKRVESWGSYVVKNVMSYTVLDINDYDNYNVFLGNSNNTQLCEVTRYFEEGGVVINETYAFTNVDINDTNYTISGNYFHDISNYSYEDWVDWDVPINHYTWEYENMTDWYLIEDVTIQPNTRYRCKIYMEQQSETLTNTKYWFAFKPTDETLPQSILENHFYCLDPWVDGTGIASDPYIIYCPEDLHNITDDLTAFYKLGNDIYLNHSDLSSESWYSATDGWAPIGDTSSNRFSGGLDGDNFTIYNMYIHKIEPNVYQGLIGYLNGANAYVKNVKMESPIIYTGGRAGSLVGISYESSPSIENCHVMNGTIESGRGTENDGRTGMLIGYGYSGTINDCTASGDLITDGDYLGGIMCANYDMTVTNTSFTGGTITQNGSGYYTGGFVGLQQSDISNCFVNDTVVNSTSHQTGGFYGFAHASTTLNCHTYNGSTNYNGTSTSFIVGGFDAGGYTTSVIRNCSSNGTVSGHGYVGGFHGGGDINVRFCKASVDVSGNYYWLGGFAGFVDGNGLSTLTDSYSTGSVTNGTQSSTSFGSFVGRVWNQSIYRCYSTGAVIPTGKSDVGGFVSSIGWVLPKSDPIYDYDNYFDNITTGYLVGDAMGKGRNTSYMQFPYGPDTYVNYSFDTVWVSEYGQYPKLAWETEKDYGTFGYAVDGGYAYSTSGQYAGSNFKFTGKTGSILTNITVWLEGWDADEELLCMVYNWSTTPTFLGKTYERQEGGSDGWYSFDLDTPVTLTNGQSYLFLLWSDGLVSIGRENGGAGSNTYLVRNSLVYLNNDAPETISSWDSNNTGYSASMYGTYTTYNIVNTTPVPWYDNNWKSVRKIRIPSYNVEEDLTNFPVLIKIEEDSDLATNAQSDGDDIMFIDNSTGIQLNHEIEHYNSSTGYLIAWVNMSLYHNMDNILWMYYDNAFASNQESVTDVWDSDYVGVYHLSETYSTDADNYKDSTINANHGTLYDNDATADVKQQWNENSIGYGVNFSGTEDAIDIGIFDYPAPFTMSAWVRSDDQVNGFDNKNDDMVGRWYGAHALREGTAGSGVISAQTYNGNETTNDIRYHSSIYAYVNRFYYLAATWESSHGSIIGADDRGHGIGYTALNNSTNNFKGQSIYPFVIGGTSTWKTGDFTACFNGTIDEVRISKIARPLPWLNTTFANQLDPTGFYIMSSRTSGTGQTSYPPTLSSPFPTNGTSNIDPGTTLSINVSDAEGNTMNITWYTSSDGSSPWIQVQQNNSITNGTFYYDHISTTTGTTYHWAVNVSDGTNYENSSYSYTTKSDFSIKWQIDNDLYKWGPVSNPVARDVNGDGYAEIFFNAVCNNTNVPGQNVIVCLNGTDGSTLWYRAINTSASNLNHSGGHLVDLDMDGTIEYVHNGGYNTFAWNAENGTEFWNSTHNSGWSGTAVVYDEDVNHYWIYSSCTSSYTDNRLYRLNGTTGVWDIRTSDDHGQTCYGGIAVWDIDRDGEYEIVATGSTGAGSTNGIKVYDMDLNLKFSLPWWQMTSHTPILEDIDGDGEMEILSAENDGESTCDGQLHIYNADGTLYQNSTPNWGAHDECVVWENTTGNWLMNSRRGSNYGEQYMLIWNLTSNSLEQNWTDDNEYGTPMKVDIYPHNGDDYEILLPSSWDDNHGSLYYMNRTTTVVPEVEHLWAGFPIFGDFDSDGYLEGIFVQSTGVTTCFDFGTEVRGQGFNTWTEQAGPRRTNAWDHYETPFVYQARFQNETPAHESTGIALTTSQVSVQINDPRGNTFNWTIETNPDIGSNSGNIESNGTKTCSISGLTEGTEYTVYVNVSDTLSDGYTRWQIYNFTSREYTPNLYLKIVIDKDYIPEDLVNFPVPITLNSTISAKCDSGKSISFRNDGNTTDFNHEIEAGVNNWNPTGENYVWVNVTNVSSTVDTIFWMRYNDSLCSNQENVHNTWNSDYTTVWHFNGTGTEDLPDSTSNDCDFITNGDTIPTLTGLVGGGRNATGPSDEFYSSSPPSIMNPGTDSRVFEFWYKSNHSASAETISIHNGVGNSRYFWNSVNNHYFSVQDDASVSRYEYFDTQTDDGEWHHLVSVINRTSDLIELYFDGVLESTTEDISAVGSINTNGSFTLLSPDTGHYAAMDEFRISKTLRSDAWLEATYNSMKHSDFITLGYGDSKSYVQNKLGFFTFNNNQNFTQSKLGFFDFDSHNNFTGNILGTTDVYENSISAENTIWGGIYHNMTEHGQVDNISFYLSGWDTGEKIKFAVYERESLSVADNIFIGQTVESSVGSPTGWVTLNISGTVLLSPSTIYYITVWSDSPVNVWYGGSSIYDGYITKSTTYNGTYTNFASSLMGWGFSSYFSYTKTGSYNQQTLGYFKFNNNLNFTQESTGYFTFKHNNNFSVDKFGWFRFNNEYNFTETKLGHFTFSNNMNYSTDSFGWFSFENVSIGWTLELTGWFKFCDNYNFTQENSGFFRFNNNLNFTKEKTGYFTFFNNLSFSQSKVGWVNFSNNTNSLSVWFTTTIDRNTITCTGSHTGILTHIAWNVTTTSGVNIGTTGWIEYTEGESITHTVSSEYEEEFIITLAGKNNHENDNQEKHLKVTYNPPEEIPEEPDFTPIEGPGPVAPSKYHVVVGGIYIDIRIFIGFSIIIIIFYIISKQKRKKKKTYRLNDNLNVTYEEE